MLMGEVLVTLLNVIWRGDTQCCGDKKPWRAEGTPQSAWRAVPGKTSPLIHVLLKGRTSVFLWEKTRPRPSTLQGEGMDGGIP